MTDVQVNPGKDVAGGRLQQSGAAAAQQTGKSNRVTSFLRGVRHRASEHRSKVSSPSRKRINMFLSAERKCADRSRTPRSADEMRRLQDATALVGLLADSIAAEASTARAVTPNEWPNCFRIGEKFGLRVSE